MEGRYWVTDSAYQLLGLIFDVTRHAYEILHYLQGNNQRINRSRIARIYQGKSCEHLRVRKYWTITICERKGDFQVMYTLLRKIIRLDKANSCAAISEGDYWGWDPCAGVSDWIGASNLTKRCQCAGESEVNLWINYLIAGWEGRSVYSQWKNLTGL